MNVHDLLGHIDSFAPFGDCADWDNSGLMVGSESAEVSKIGVCLDAVKEAVIAASEQGCNVLVCHHPLIFHPLNRIDDETEQGRTIMEAIRRNVNIISVHTCWDTAEAGVNDTLAALLELEDVCMVDNDSRMGACGEFRRAMNLERFMKFVKNAWGLSHIAVYGNLKRIKTVALCGGSGGEYWQKAQDQYADIYLTADMKYHDISDAVNNGFAIGLVDHGEMERAMIPALAEEIAEWGVETVIIDVKALPAPVRI